MKYYISRTVGFLKKEKKSITWLIWVGKNVKKIPGRFKYADDRVEREEELGSGSLSSWAYR